MELFSSGEFPSVVAARRCSSCLMSDVDACVSAIWGPQRNGDPGPISLGFWGDPKSPLIASVLVITARVRGLGLGLLRPYIALTGVPKTLAPNRGGGGISR